MTPAPTDWHLVAVSKLTNVMGASAASEIALSILKELGIEKLSSAADLRRFAAALGAQQGFAAAVGGLLALHATMYDERNTSR
ncbi:MAG: hypothetical protein ABIP89_02420 [Polyangiaceae bacterium]